MTTFAGKREDGVDYFDDITSRDDAGIYAGSGIDDYEGLKESVNQDGVQVRMNCRRCGKAHAVTIEWQELYLVGSNGPGKSLLMPRGWQYSPNNHKLYPMNVPCSKCQEPLCPQFTPEEARNRVTDALHRGLIQPQLAQQWQQEVASVRAQGG
jgi:hypothetical protein